MTGAELLDSVIALARAAGHQTLAVYATDFAIYGKEDASSVTDADHLAQAVIIDGLRDLTPHIPIISEEQAAAERSTQGHRRFWLVDPLDGTAEFIKRNGEFTVNIALVEDTHPILGVVYAPALDRLFTGVPGAGARTDDHGGSRRIACRVPPAEGLTVVGSRSHENPEALQAFLAEQKIAARTAVGSSLKFCLVAAGEADLYPRLGPTMEWDTAAGHAVLLAAGGHVRTLEGNELAYGKPGLVNPHFCAFGLAAA